MEPERFDEIIKHAHNFYLEMIDKDTSEEADRARAYLADMNRNGSQIGFAPAKWDALVEHLHSFEVSDKEILEAGLALDSRTGVFDRLRNRLAIPVRDYDSRTCGFIGFSLDGDPTIITTTNLIEQLVFRALNGSFTR
jgi:DNA primase